MSHDEKKRKGMQKVRPFRTQEEQDRCAAVARLHDAVAGRENCSWELLWLLGIGTGLRISDLTRLRVRDVRAPEGWKIHLAAKKTGKELGDGEGQVIPKRIRGRIMELTAGREMDEWLFLSRQKDKYSHDARPISRQRAWEIVNEIAQRAGISGKIGCHSLRKTFGMNFYRKYGELAYLQKIFGHASELVTSRYIGLDQEVIDNRLENL